MSIQSLFGLDNIWTVVRLLYGLVVSRLYARCLQKPPLVSGLPRPIVSIFQHVVYNHPICGEVSAHGCFFRQSGKKWATRTQHYHRLKCFFVGTFAFSFFFWTLLLAYTEEVSHISLQDGKMINIPGDAQVIPQEHFCGGEMYKQEKYDQIVPLRLWLYWPGDRGNILQYCQ